MTAVARIIGSIAAALISGASVFLLLALLFIPLTSLVPPMFGIAVAITHAAAGFAFVFVGSMVVCGGWRIPTAIFLLGLGIVIYLFEQTRYTSEPEAIPGWPFVAALTGGLLALGVQVWNKQKDSANKALHATAAPPEG
jgi:hypothetical protein